MKNIMLGCLFSLLMFSVTDAKANNDHSQHTLMGSHGMALIYHKDVGLLASHMPLYYSPHDHQIIYKVEVDKLDDVLAMTKKGLVTILPKNFDLQKLIDGTQFSIQSDFYQGHFERGGKLTHTSNITFTKLVLSKPLEPKFSSDDNIFYVQSLSEKTALLVHKIQAKPSFDAIAFVANDAVKDLSLKTCEQTTTSEQKKLVEQLAECGIPPTAYLETKDFM